MEKLGILTVCSVKENKSLKHRLLSEEDTMRVCVGVSLFCPAVLFLSLSSVVSPFPLYLARVSL